MPTPNREHGELLLPDGMVLDTTVGDPSSPGGVRYNGTDFRMRDSAGVFNPRADYGFRRHFALMGA